MIKKARSGSTRALPDSEMITDPGRIAGLLDRLAKRHTLLTVFIPGHPGHYTSCIVHVDRPYVLLDELVPADGHRLLLAERTLRVTGKLDGIDIRFTATLERVEERDDIITYYVNLPALLEYRQRRVDYRAHVPMARTLRVVIDCNAATVIEGRLQDLSHGGAGIAVAHDTHAMEPGRLYECAVELPDGVWLYCGVELRHAKNIPTRERRLYGARFVDLSPVQSRLLRNCITALERELIRKRAAD